MSSTEDLINIVVTTPTTIIPAGKTWAGSAVTAISGSLLGIGLRDLAGLNDGSLALDVVNSFEYTYNQDVTDHPVETGFAIQDHITNFPMRLRLQAGVSSHPITWKWYNGKGSKKFNNAYNALQSIRDTKQPVTIVRPERIYYNMVLTDCRVTKDDSSKSVIYVELDFKKIVTVDVMTASIPENIVTSSQQENVGETEANGGSAGVTNEPRVSTAKKAGVGDFLGIGS